MKICNQRECYSHTHLQFHPHSNLASIASVGLLHRKFSRITLLEFGVVHNKLYDGRMPVVHSIMSLVGGRGINQQGSAVNIFYYTEHSFGLQDFRLDHHVALFWFKFRELSPLP